MKGVYSSVYSILLSCIEQSNLHCIDIYQKNKPEPSSTINEPPIKRCHWKFLTIFTVDGLVLRKHFHLKTMLWFSGQVFTIKQCSGS